jgi:hypothetical protein
MRVGGAVHGKIMEEREGVREGRRRGREEDGGGKKAIGQKGCDEKKH